MAKKLTKQDLKEPDEFQVTSWRLIQYFTEHKKKFFTLIGTLIGIFILLSVWSFYNSYIEKKAGVLYAKASKTYSFTNDQKKDKESCLEAIKLFKELVNTYPSSSVSPLAFYSMGNIYYHINNFDSSVEAYQSFLKKAPEDSFLIFLAHYGLGYAYEAKKDFENALKSYQKSEELSQSTYFTAVNFQNIARVYEKTNDKSKAVEYYKKAQEITKDTLMEMLIKSKISELS